MKKLILLCAAVTALSGLPVSAADAPGVSARAAIVLHADTGTVLYEKNADEELLIASTTKIMTAQVALERCDPDMEVTIRPEWTGIEGSSMYLKAGETYTLRELLYGMLLASGNDAATAVACTVAGSEDAFAALMNEKAAELGLTGTSFENPHGLDSPDHHSTARDLAVLAAYAMENEEFAAIVSTRSKTIHDQTYVNHNKLLWQCEGTIGVKTGYTKAAGRALVSCCEREGTRYICVTLDDPCDWADHAVLYDWAFAEYTYVTAVEEDFTVELPAVCDGGGTVTVMPAEPVRALVRPEDTVALRLELPRFVFPGVLAGDRAGRVTVTVNGVPAGETTLVYREDLPLPDRHRTAV